MSTRGARLTDLFAQETVDYLVWGLAILIAPIIIGMYMHWRSMKQRFTEMVPVNGQSGVQGVSSIVGKRGVQRKKDL